ncbi:MAG: SMC-Scp complex subunit ScpB, partial [Pseudomonadota bacterium]
MTADDLALESAAEPVTEAAETADAAQTVEAAPTDEAIDETAEAAAEDATETAPPEDEPLAALPEDAAERMVEALLFASASPLSDEDIAGRLPGAADVPVIMARLCERYAGRGVEVRKVADRWTLRTAPDLGFLLETEKVEQRKLSRAALETLAIIAYHQPATRAEIEEVRGVAVSKGTLDLL